MRNNEQPQQDPKNGTSADEKKKQERDAMTAALVLIGIGIVCLMARYIEQVNWNTLWSTALIVLGLILIIPTKSKAS